MILLLQRSPVFRFDEWLGDLAREAVLFTQLAEGGGEGYAEVVRIPSFDADGRTELRIVEQHARTPFTAVVPMSEYDLIRAARLRERFGIPGQSVASATAYRDKVRMKELVAAAGIAVPGFRAIESPLDLVAAAEGWGYPLVVKPVDGGGSRGVTIVRDAAALEQLLAGGCPANTMVEQFVPGQMCHVDGLARHGTVAFSAASQYLNDCLGFQSGRSVGSRLLDPRSDLARRLNAAVAAVVRALPPTPVLTYHAEFFHTPDDRIVFCEIASRCGGSRIIETIEEGYGVNVARAWVRWQAGLSEDVTGHPFDPAGWLLIPALNQGRLVRIPERIPFAWTSHYWPVKKPGDVVGNAQSSVDGIATMIVRGADDATVNERLQELDAWFARSLEWEPAGAGA